MTEPRVAHVLRKYDPSEWGGTETHVAAVTRGLLDQGWQVEVHAPAGPEAEDHALASGVRLVRFRAHNPFLGCSEGRRKLISNAGNIFSIEEPWRLVNDKQLALVHLHTLGRIGGGVRTAMRLSQRPYIVSIHGPVLSKSDAFDADMKRRHRGLVDLGAPIGLLFGSRRVLDDAARVICFNDGEHRALRARIGHRAIRMDHGVDEARLRSADPARARARFPQLVDKPTIALVGRISTQKNQILAVRAFARGAPPDHSLALAGAETDAGYRAEIVGEARSLGVAERVHLLGNLNPNTEIPDLYHLSKLVIVPSTYEAFGLAVLEGWAAGRPVLFARRSGLADIAGALRDDSLALPTLDVNKWAAAIARLSANDHARRAAADAGAMLVRTRFQWSSIAKKLSHLYAEVLRENARRP